MLLCISSTCSDSSVADGCCSLSAAEVVEVVGSPGLRESLEARIGDVLNEVPVDKTDAIVPDYTVFNQAGKGTVVGDKDMPLSSSVDPASVSLADADSQDSILDIEGVVHDDGMSLMEWIADDSDGRGEPGGGNSSAQENPISHVEVPKHHEGGGVSAVLQDDCESGSWRPLVHPDDPFLCLVPCEVARVASALQAHQHNHLETYRHLGFRLSGTRLHIDHGYTTRIGHTHEDIAPHSHRDVVQLPW